ncbi:sialate O-acetylesterase [Aquiflexum sp.]|uniref:sialate O-acetylesterase n=1 Tax=Aquiflexum sp. TaxID=1872584 RepID=UPI0035941C50
MNALFSDGMVLQQNSSVSVFGNSEPNYSFSFKAEWLDDEFKVKSNSDGRFLFNVSTPSAGGPYKMQVDNKIINDILVGEVWLGSGQSNMQMRLKETDVNLEELVKNSEIRLFTVPVQDSMSPLTHLSNGNWVSGDNLEMLLQESAVAYYYALTLQEELKVPVGIITASRGASAAEEWIRGDSYENLPDSIKSLYKPDPPKYPSSWYNGMISPIIPYKIKGVIWYQGEANVPRKASYPILIETLVEDLRIHFEDENLPFFMVQLPTFKREWQEFRLVQESIADKMNHSGMVTTLDLGDENDIHPKRKKEVGQRLAHLSLAKVYQKDFRFSSPRYSQIEFTEDIARITFLHAEEGLITQDGMMPKYFELAGKDGVYHPATAKIHNNIIEIKSPEISSPTAVRYFWIGYGKPNLISKDGYPVAPFNYPHLNFPFK